MSIYSNNIMLHNLRAIARMGQRMQPATVVTACAVDGLEVSLKLAEALAEPGALERLQRKPLTHKKVDAHLEAHRILTARLAQLAVEALTGRQQPAGVDVRPHEVSS